MACVPACDANVVVAVDRLGRLLPRPLQCEVCRRTLVSLGTPSVVEKDAVECPVQCPRVRWSRCRVRMSLARQGSARKAIVGSDPHMCDRFDLGFVQFFLRHRVDADVSCSSRRRPVV